MSWLQEWGWLSIPIAALAAMFTGWNAFNTWRRDVSRFKFTLTYPPSYKRDDIRVTAIYKGGPPLKVTKARVRVVRIAGVVWFEREPEPGVDAILRPENREVPVMLDPTRKEHFWYVEVLTDGGAKRRKWLRRIPPFWRKKLELGIAEMADSGAVGSERRMERAVKKLGKAFKKDQR